MSVVNCRVKYIRPRYKDLKDWISDPNNVYIGRGGVLFIDGKRFPEKNSKFANPFYIGNDGTREKVIEKYEMYITNKIEQDPSLKGELLSLKGKNLGCWCHPDPCHGHVLLKLIEKYT